MSHLVTIKTEIRDPLAIRAACQRLGLPAPIHGTTRLFDGATPTGWQVKLPGWNYPLVCQENGTLACDTFRGHWGDEKHLDAFKQAYAVEKAIAEASRQGYRFSETKLQDGTVRLTINAGA